MINSRNFEDRSWFAVAEFKKNITGKYRWKKIVESRKSIWSEFFLAGFLQFDLVKENLQNLFIHGVFETLRNTIVKSESVYITYEIQSLPSQKRNILVT